MKRVIRSLWPVVVVAPSIAPYPFSQGASSSTHDVAVGLSQPGDPGLVSADYSDNFSTEGNWTDLGRLNSRWRRASIPKSSALVSYLAITFITSLGAMFFASRRPRTASEVA
jgi:hypothetical protein